MTSVLATGGAAARPTTGMAGLAPTDLGTLGGAQNSANDVSDAGQIVGDSHDFLWRDGAMDELGTLGGQQSEAHGVNVTGQIVGWAQGPQGARAAA